MAERNCNLRVSTHDMAEVFFPDFALPRYDCLIWAGGFAYPVDLQSYAGGSLELLAGVTLPDRSAWGGVRLNIITISISILFSYFSPSGPLIRCRDLSDLDENDICAELKDQGVVEVRRVTVKKNGKAIPTNTLFLTFNRLDLPKAICVVYLQVKVDLFVPNPLRCFGCFVTSLPKCILYKGNLLWLPPPPKTVFKFKNTLYVVCKIKKIKKLKWTFFFRPHSLLCHY